MFPASRHYGNEASRSEEPVKTNRLLTTIFITGIAASQEPIPLEMSTSLRSVELFSPPTAERQGLMPLTATPCDQLSGVIANAPADRPWSCFGKIHLRICVKVPKRRNPA